MKGLHRSGGYRKSNLLEGEIRFSTLLGVCVKIWSAYIPEANPTPLWAGSTHRPALTLTQPVFPLPSPTPLHQPNVAGVPHLPGVCVQKLESDSTGQCTSLCQPNQLLSWCKHALHLWQYWANTRDLCWPKSLLWLCSEMLPKYNKLAATFPKHKYSMF